MTTVFWGVDLLVLHYDRAAKLPWQAHVLVLIKVMT